ncbi:22546_t:CDS:2, partial [Racocetra persica]
MQTRRDGEFKWIAHARDHFLSFFWGRILTDKYANIINNLSKLRSNLKIIHEKPRRPQTQGSVERANF